MGDAAGRSDAGTGTGRWRRPLLAAALGATVTLAACTEEATPPTAEELLAELEGRELTAVEEQEFRERYDMLCDLSDEVLLEVWSRLDGDQLDYQDVAFSRYCPERIELYATATGRFITDE